MNPRDFLSQLTGLSPLDLGVAEQLVGQQALLGGLLLARVLGLVLCLGGLLFRLELRMRLGLAGVLCLMLLMRLDADSPPLTPGTGWVTAAVAELALGAGVGLGAAVVLLAVRLGAEFLGQFPGTIDGPGGGWAGGLGGGGDAAEEGRPLQRLFKSLAVLVFLQSQGHVRVVQACQRSLDLWPVGHWQDQPVLGDWIPTLLQQAVLLGLNLAGPLLAGCGLAALGVALIVRWLPQLEGLTVLPSCRLALCWLILACGLPGVVHQLERYAVETPSVMPGKGRGAEAGIATERAPP
ncbi:MAG: flagellar biosynthetic protein FliR [Planctomycetaceae bacterium]